MVRSPLRPCKGILKAHLSSLAANRAKYEVPTAVHWALKPYMAAMLRTCSREPHPHEGAESYQ